ncbi:MAG: glucose 1-dehydrogenase [Chloroflexota bacterium]
MHTLQCFELTGKVAVVTGAARGLGRQIALALAEAGADVAICDLLEIEGEETLREIRALGRVALFGRVDVSRSVEVQPFVQQVIQRLGKIDILVNNAGIPTRSQSLEDVEDGEWRNFMEVDLSSMFYFAKPVAKHMIERGEGGVIINMASINSFVISNLGARHNVPYCVAKGGVAQLTRGMAANWATHNIRVNAIAPGYMLTPMAATIQKFPELLERVVSSIPMKRFGRPEEIKGTVVYLASDASSYMTGTIVVMDGGITIW